MENLTRVRIGTDVHLYVTVHDAGVPIGWNSASVTAFVMKDKSASNLPYSTSGFGKSDFLHCTTQLTKDNTVLDVCVPAMKQMFLTLAKPVDMRLTLTATVNGSTSTYDALAFTFVPRSADLGDNPLQDNNPINLEMTINEVSSSEIIRMVNECQAILATIEGKEADREFNEGVRQSNEATRIANEEERKTNEATRDAQEAERVEEFATLKQNAETVTSNANQATLIANSNEQSRANEEANRQRNEANRQNAEQSRVSAEQSRARAEQTRDINETTRKNAETARKQAETTRQTTFESGESSRQSTFESGESSRQSTFNTNETNRVNEFNTLKEQMNVAKTGAETATTNANTAANNANDKAALAEAAATTAETKTQEALDKVDQAQVIVNAEKLTELDGQINGVSHYEEITLDLSLYDDRSGYINNNVWKNVTSSVYLHKLIPATGLTKVEIIARGDRATTYAFLKSDYKALDATPDFCDDTLSVRLSNGSSSGVVSVPSDCAYIYVWANSSTGVTLPTFKSVVSEQAGGLKDDVLNLDERVTTLEQGFSPSTELGFPTIEKVLHLEEYRGQATSNPLANRLYNYTHRYVTSSNTWNSTSSEINIYFNPNGALALKIKANDQLSSTIALLKDVSSFPIGESVRFASGYNSVIIIPPSEERIIKIPYDCGGIMILKESSTGNRQPQYASLITSYAFDKKKPIVAFLDDDCRQSALEWWESVIDSTHIPVSFACISGFVGETIGERYSSWDELRRLQGKGFNFVCHGYNIADSITLHTQEELTADFSNAQKAMQEHGMLDFNVFVYPQGTRDDSSLAIVKKFFSYALNTAPKLNIDEVDRFDVFRIGLDGSPTEEQMLNQRQWVDKAIETNGFCLFYGHAFHEDYTEERKQWHIDLINYIKGKGVRILNVSDALKEFFEIS